MSAAEAAPYLSLVILVYDEEGNVVPLHPELTRTAATRAVHAHARGVFRVWKVLG